MKFNVRKPPVLSWVSEESWNKLKLKEKDFMIMISSRKYTKKQIMRKLHLETENGYWRLNTKVKSLIKTDIASRNENIKSLG